jgi:alpha-glucosidase (family GH31 glycosyl hydrolase)
VLVPTAARSQEQAQDVTVLRLDGVTVEVAAAPWGLRITDDAGRVVLDERAGTGPTAAGTVGFQTGVPRRHRAGPLLPDKAPFGEVDAPSLGWWHATRARDVEVAGGELRALLDTTDPLGRRIALTVRGAGQGSAAISAEVVGGPTTDVEAVGMGFQARPGERFVGFGERNDVVGRTGVVEHYVGEGPYQREEYPFLQPAIVPAWGARQRADATYFPVPWLLSSAGYGVLVDDDEVSNHRLRQDAPDAWSVEVLATSLDLTVHSGPRPADALRRMVRDLGHQPSPRPTFYGPWVQPFTSFTVDLATQLGQVDLLRDADAPFSAVEVTHRYLPCGQHRGKRESIRAAVDAFHGRGLEAYGYNNPLVCSKYGESYDRAIATGGFQRRPDGDPYLFTSYVGAATPPVETVGQLDLGSPAGDAVLFENLDLATADGHDGWMEDFGEYTQFDAVSADGTTGDRLHNRYVRDYHCAAQRYADEADRAYARFVRSGWTGSAACSPIVWSGDPTSAGASTAWPRRCRRA